MNLRLVNIDTLEPSTYNPRKADPRRLDIIELSLIKLGFVLPVYAHRSGEILSGHQRHYVAGRMGVKQMPVCYVEQMNLAERKAINIAFNRGTNDFSYVDTPKNITDALGRVDIEALAAALPDIEIGSPEFYPCLQMKNISVRTLTRLNGGKWSNYSRNIARLLHRRGIDMPIVCGQDNKLVNGIGRLQYAAEKRRDKIAVVNIDNEKIEFAHAMLNLLSMDFDIHSRYKDLLRYNSFRRARRVRSELGLGFIFVIAPGVTAKAFDVIRKDNARRWIREHGTHVVDFGAGHLHEAKILQKIGVNVAAFEPFRLGADSEIDKAASIALGREFLAIIERGQVFSSIFVSSVLNSVPFRADREKIVCLCAALCGDRTRLYAVASNTDQVGLRNVKGANVLSDTNSNTALFRLDYEDNITIGDFGDKPKVQKYHSSKEFYELFKKYFLRVKVELRGNNATAVCEGVDWEAVKRDLQVAIEFEFDLMYPDGSRMGLVDEARVAYETRLAPLSLCSAGNGHSSTGTSPAVA
jgi:ParB/Sulfiredoxin domain